MFKDLPLINIFIFTLENIVISNNNNNNYNNNNNRLDLFYLNLFVLSIEEVQRKYF